jgi:hypothetical protein
MPQNVGLTRRRLFMLAAGVGAQASLRLYGAGGDFWNKKDPGEWSSDEIDRLVTKSPWAKEVNAASVAISKPYGTAQGNGGGMGVPGNGGGAGYPGGGMGGRGGGSGRHGDAANQMPLSYRATVRWESAKPIQQALKTPLTEGLVGAYVISVSGVPILARSHQHSDEGDTDSTVSKGLSEEVLDRIKNLTYLEPKGKSPAQPSVVRKGAISSSGMPTLLFGFPREELSLSEDDREVAFSTKLGEIDIKCKFSMKDMMYHKELAL